jgi:hypothetical protein
MTNQVAEALYLVPTCRPVDVLSYTTWSGMRSCEWKAAYSRDGRTRGLSRGSTYSATGNARHAVEEEVAAGLRRGNPRPSRDWVQARFLFVLGQEADALQAQWAPAEVPEFRKWPHVTSVRVALARRLGDPAAGSDSAFWSDVNAPLAPVKQVPDVSSWHPPDLMPGDVIPEAWLIDVDRGMRGQVDRLARDEAAISVIDFKSGIGAGPEELLRKHRTQLLFYAGLVESCFGDWPTLAIDPVEGRGVSVGYESSDVSALREDVSKTRESFNVHARDNEFQSRAAVPESPCLWCDFRVICPVVRQEWREIVDAIPRECGRAISLAEGVIQSVSATQGGTQVEIVQPTSLTARPGQVTLTRMPPELNVSPGDVVAVAGLQAVGAQVLRADWTSTIWVAEKGGS